MCVCVPSAYRSHTMPYKNESTLFGCIKLIQDFSSVNLLNVQLSHKVTAGTIIRFFFLEPLVDSVALDGGVMRIQKANADEFIHIFVNQSQKLTEFLEHMVKVSIV